jgi:ATP-dependent protease ClpP protease subunit
MSRYIQMRMSNKGKGEFRAENNTIWLYDAIAADDLEAEWWGGISPSAFIEALRATTGPVTLRINSPGGSVFGAQAMVADSLAASAASVIASNCATCVMVPGSMQMIHRAWGLAIGNCTDMRDTADLLEKIDGLIADAYAGRADGKTDRAAFEAMMAAETWFTPEEAVAAGLCDAVAEENTQRAANRWDLSAFAAAPETMPGPVIEPDAQPNAEAIAIKDRAQRVARLNARLMANPV